MELSQITLAAFAAFNALRLFSYFPQIVRIATDTNGASAISFSTWFLWTGSHLATGAYAAVNLNDHYLTLASALFASCCLAVIALTGHEATRHVACALRWLADRSGRESPK